jgi:hypothetical protein
MIAKIILGIFTIIMLPAEIDGLHDFHLSKAEVHYNEVNQSLEVSLHLFLDDLEDGMIKNGMENPNFSTSQEHPQADSLLNVYLESHFAAVIDDQKISFTFLGKEDGEDLTAIWCYLEGKNIPPPKKIELENKILVDLFEDQKNIVAFTSKQKKEFLLFDLKKQKATINL